MYIHTTIISSIIHILAEVIAKTPTSRPSSGRPRSAGTSLEQAPLSLSLSVSVSLSLSIFVCIYIYICIHVCIYIYIYVT